MLFYVYIQVASISQASLVMVVPTPNNGSTELITLKRTVVRCSYETCVARRDSWYFFI